MLGPARRTTALVLVDQRGTGESELIDCAPLQDFPYAPFAPVALRPYRLAVGRCGAGLGDRSDAYGTGAAVDDMVDVLDALGLARVDVYGDSYGSYAAQTLALRHPDRVRSLVLDGTYPLDYDVWARDALAVLRCALRSTCERSPTCPWRAAIRSSACATLALQPARASARGLVARPRRATSCACASTTAASPACSPRPTPTSPSTATSRPPSRPTSTATRHRSRASPPRPSPAAPTGPRSTTRPVSTPRSSATTTRSCSTSPRSPAAAPGADRRAAAAPAGRCLRAVRPRDLVRRRSRELRLVRALAAGDARARSAAPARRRLPVACRRSCWTAISTSARRSSARATWPRSSRDSTLVPVPNAGHVTALVDWTGCMAGIVRRFVATTRVSGTACAARNPAAAPRRGVPAHVGERARGDAGARRRVAARRAPRGVVRRAGRLRRDRALQPDPRARAGWACAAGTSAVRGRYLESHPVTLRLTGARFCADVPVSGDGALAPHERRRARAASTSATCRRG